MGCHLERPKLGRRMTLWVGIFQHPRPLRLLGRWPVSVRGVIDEKGPPRLHPELHDWIEVNLALGRRRGLLRAGTMGWSWGLLDLNLKIAP